MIDKPTATEFAKLLGENVMKIEFEKLDGAIRQMVATRKGELIPEDHQPKSSTPVSDEDNIVAVFDMQVCGWRSVRPSSLISMEVFKG